MFNSLNALNVFITEAASVHSNNFNLNSNDDKFVTTKQKSVPNFILYSNSVISAINRSIKATSKGKKIFNIIFI